MMNSGARRCGLVVLSAESAERSTTHLCQIFGVTWLLCHPDLSGLRIYDLVLVPPTNIGVNFSKGSRLYRLHLGRLVVLGGVDCSGQSTVQMPTSAQLRANRMIVLVKKRVDRLRLGRLLAFGTADCLGAIGRTPAQLGPAADQSVHPCPERLLSLG